MARRINIRSSAMAGTYAMQRHSSTGLNSPLLLPLAINSRHSPLKVVTYEDNLKYAEDKD